MRRDTLVKCVAETWGQDVLGRYANSFGGRRGPI